MYYTELPKEITVNGIIYHLQESVGKDDWDEWFFAGYFPTKGQGLPPLVNNKRGYQLYLCSAETSSNKARKDLLNRLNLL